ncbi:Pilus assembly protein, PilO [Poriferisphaera corsica]|uniref:Pilus assembly protein, PilO n=1 Tax=Poriferisphaera corsica TaxID=2528020 RepID=A0A517YUS3_9BACT|nr:type 4a pilus biogenesis protein PilO [Poriferisphaera corsica]QDU33974.1 Pilus assembly protein, PilO [Poriferisphaera corsica]
MYKYFYILIILATPVLSYVFLFQPRAYEIQKIEDNIAGMNEQLQIFEASKKDIAELSDEIAKVEESLTRLKAKLPDQKNVENVLRNVWNIATKHNLETRNFRTDKIQNIDNYMRVPIEMTITGDFDGYYEFLQQLESLPRIIKIPTMTIESLNNHDGTIQANIYLNVYCSNDIS